MAGTRAQVPTGFGLGRAWLALHHGKRRIVERALELLGYFYLALDRGDDRLGEIDPGERVAAAQIARREDVHLEDLVADDVDPDQEHAVGDQLVPDELGDAQLGVADLDRDGLAASVDVAADVIVGADSPERRIFLADRQRVPV